MSNTSLDISGKIDTETITVYRTIALIAERLNLPVLVVGATARDAVLHYAHGTPIQRATTDIDFGIQVASWQEFEQLYASAGQGVIVVSVESETLFEAFNAGYTAV